MLRSLKELLGYTIRATDGELGKVRDFFFDDKVWTIRYLAADTGGWLSGRQVLLSPQSFGKPDWSNKIVPVNLTREAIEHSPPIESDQPISRQYESMMAAHYGWAPYWGMEGTPLVQPPEVIESLPSTEDQARSDPNLRSMRDTIHLTLHATDGDAGRVHDFIVQSDDWVIRYMVADIGHLLSGKKVLVSPAWIRDVDWTERAVYVDLEQSAIREGPPFDYETPVNREYEVRLYDFYGRPVYWEGELPELTTTIKDVEEK
ncbi:MAG: PRC-barrel domain-containing protein [Planctomycetaceae bacterium]|nr:PRC-barrel domain-containing protein [Planctomycetaceae bacterium]